MYVTFRHIVVTGHAQRRVHCEKCQHIYEYAFTRAEELDTVPLPPLIKQAEEICQERLAKKLAEGHEAVSCPSCGWLQQHMTAELRNRFLSPMRTIGAFVACACGALAILGLGLGAYFSGQPRRPSVDEINWLGIGGFGLAGVAVGMLMILSRRWLGQLRYANSGFAVKSPMGAHLLVEHRVAA